MWVRQALIPSSSDRYFSLQYAVVYFEPEGDVKYKLPAKPKLVSVPDSEIQMVCRPKKAKGWD